MEADTNESDGKSSRSLVDAIKEKYSSDEEDTVIEIFVPRRHATCDTGDNIVVPQELSLDGYGINCSGKKETIASLCKHITFLDLSENQISDWTQIYHILDETPKVCFLGLRHNPLNTSVTSHHDGKVYPFLHRLVLNRTFLPWDSIQQVLQIFPDLQELHLSLNDYETVDFPPDFVYTPLTSLHFNGNKLQRWEDIMKLSQAFPNLENLLLMQNPVATLCSSSEEPHFQNLKVINLSQTLLNCWKDVEKLQEFPKLTELRLQGIPLLENYSEELSRHLTLAYLPNIQRLNGSKIFAYNRLCSYNTVPVYLSEQMECVQQMRKKFQIEKESSRDEAERAFLRHEPVSDIESHRQSSRFLELKAKYGELEPLPLVDLHLKDKLKVTFIHGPDVFEKEVETRWTVSELKLNLQSRVKIPWNRMRLWHEESDGHTTSLEELKSVCLPISRYGLTDGDELMIDQS